MKIAANRILYHRPNKSEGKRRVHMPKMWNNNIARRWDRKRLHNHRTSGEGRISQEANNKMQQLRKPDPLNRLRVARLANAENAWQFFWTAIMKTCHTGPSRKKPEEAEELSRELFVQQVFSCESPPRRGWQQKKERRGTTSCHPTTAGANLPQQNCLRILYLLPRNSTGKMNRVLPLTICGT